MILQYQLSNGQWTDCDDRSDEFLGYAVDYNKTSLDGVLASLSEGKAVRHAADEWYQVLRYKPAPTATKPRPVHTPCKSCGETNPARFTTLPAHLQTCDDCA